MQASPPIPEAGNAPEGVFAPPDLAPDAVPALEVAPVVAPVPGPAPVQVVDPPTAPA